MTTHIHPRAVEHAVDHLTRIPRPDQISVEKIREWATSQGSELDPKTTLAVTLHYKPNPEGGWIAKVAEEMPISQAVLSKWQSQPDTLDYRPTDIFSALSYLGLLKQWSLPVESWSSAFANAHVQIVDELPSGGTFGTLDDYGVYQGLFRKAEPMLYNHDTQITLDTKAFQDFIWALDFHSQYIAQLDDYWLHAFDDYATLVRANFIAACNTQVAEGSLSEAGCELAWRAAGIAHDDALPTAEEGQIEVRMLNIYGYAATDIPCIIDRASGLTLLYIPGNSSPLHTFETADAMKVWLVEQCKDDEKRDALITHFSLQDLPTGPSFTGLEGALKGLANYRGQQYRFFDNVVTPVVGWTTHFINYKVDEYSPLITDGLFTQIALKQKQRSYDDAQVLITTNSDIIKAKWRGYLNLTLTMLAPLAIIVPGLGWVVAVGGVAQLGMGLEEIINAKNPQQKIEGVINTAFGALCAAPLVGDAWAGGKRFFRTQFDGFVAPSRVNGQIGYPLSPPGPPKPRWTGKTFNAFFEQPVRVEPVPQPAHLAVTRQTTHASLDTLVDTHNPQTHLLYDLETDSFITEGDAQAASPTRYIAQDNQLRACPSEATGQRVVTNAMRETTLRGLGINLALPPEVPAITPVGSSPIPRKVMHLWIGDTPLTPGITKSLQRNARLLKDAGYSHYLYVPTKHTASIANALADTAPDLQVLPLEDQAFYREMGYTRQYFDAAMTGPPLGGSHLIAATDMLKYHALYHEGGLYMDINNDLLATASHPSAGGIVNEAAPSDWIGNIPLETTPDGLLLEQPTSNPFKGSHLQYNTSVIGSHPKNPNVQEVIRTMESRLDTRPHFFSTKSSLPVRRAYATTYAAYNKTISGLTGTDMFTDVVDRRLPAYRQMRQLYKLFSCPLAQYPTLVGADLQPISQQGLQATLQSLFSVSRTVRVNKGFGWINLQ